MTLIETGSYKHRIKGFYTSLSNKEKQIADYILNNPEIIMHSSINEVAAKINVAEATVFRFCKRMGFKGYQDMKIALASEPSTTIKDIHETIQEGDSEKTVAEKVFRSNIRTLETTLSVIDSVNFAAAVNAIITANRVEFLGNGGSGIIALDAHHKFMRTGIPTIAYNDGHLQIMSLSQLTSKDVAVFISHTGASNDIIQALAIAKKRNVTTIGITTLAKSPLSQGVDIPLYTISEETEYRSEALSSRLAQLSIIDALYVNVSIARKDLMQTSLQNIREAISHKRIKNDGTI